MKKENTEKMTCGKVKKSVIVFAAAVLVSLPVSLS